MRPSSELAFFVCHYLPPLFRGEGRGGVNYHSLIISCFLLLTVFCRSTEHITRSVTCSDERGKRRSFPPFTLRHSPRVRCGKRHCSFSGRAPDLL